MTKLRHWELALLTLLFFLSTPRTFAHAFSNAFVNFEITQQEVQGTLKLRVQDIVWLADLDSNRDQQLSWRELQQGQAALQSVVKQQLQLTTAGERCEIAMDTLSLQQLNTGMFVVLPLRAMCPAVPVTLGVDYHLMMTLDAAHRGIIEVHQGTNVSTGVFTPDTQTLQFSLTTLQSHTGLIAFLQEGVWHIWTGYDHLLFLLALMLPLFLRRDEGLHWQLPQTQTVVRSVLWTVTAFTLAHSITLVLASVLELQLASALVETLIAVTVALSGLNILCPIFSNNHSTIAFSFGLIHGLGFAGALRDLSLPPGAFLQSLLSFNLGVEAGQLALVALVFPLLLYLRRQRYYQSFLQPLLSVGIVAIGIAWAFTRGVEI